MDVSQHHSDLDNVFHISIKGDIAFSSLSLFFFSATVFELLFGDACEKEKTTALLDMRFSS